jgi:hypothetical protein
MHRGGLSVCTRDQNLPEAVLSRYLRWRGCRGAGWRPAEKLFRQPLAEVDVTGDTTPWFPGSLTADLERLLGRRVQVVIRRSLSPLIRDAVLRESVPL